MTRSSNDRCLNPGEVPRQFRDLAKLAIKQGWEIRSTTSHLEWKPPDPDAHLVITSHSPGDGNAVKAVTADLRRAGMITDSTEWNRLRNWTKKVEKLMEPGERYYPPDVQTVFVNLESIIDTQGAAELVDSLGLRQALKGQITDEEFASHVRGMRELADEYPVVISRMLAESAAASGADKKAKVGITIEPNADGDYLCPCGATSKELPTIVAHRSTCDGTPKQNTQELEDDVERDMRARPPDHNRLDCPKCTRWFYVSQPQELTRHLEEEHGLARCDACGKVMQPESLTKHLDRYCPILFPNKPRTRKPKKDDVQIHTTISAAAPYPPGTPPGNPPAMASAPQEPPPAVPSATPAPQEPEVVPATVLRVPLQQSPETPADQPPSDEDLFAALQMVVGESVPLTPATFAKINDWVRLTRELWMESRTP